MSTRPVPSLSRISALVLVAGTLTACAPVHVTTRPESLPASTPVATGSRPAAPAVDAPSRFADSVIALMTLEEKLGQLVQWPGSGRQADPQAQTLREAQIRAGKVGSFLNVFGAEYTRRLQRVAVEESRRKIPLLFGHDVIHGFRTIFPIPLAEAGSFDPVGAEQAARLAATEATANGIHWTFAPMVDIARDPRWGRIAEGAGEDPYLGSVMAAARVRGFQGGDGGANLAANNTMMATVKHFAGYGGAEGGRDYNSVELTERTLWEIYLPPFHAAVKAGAASLMASFNDIGGTPSHANAWLLGDVLRERWGFRGVVLSDWGAIGELVPHGVAASTGEAGIRAIRAGVDVDMSDGIYGDSLPAAVSAGRVEIARVDTAVRRVLRAKYALGLFDDPYRYSDAEREKRFTLAPEYVTAAREAGRKAIVLLKNDDGTLPLRKNLRSIAVIGPLADDARSALGNWAADGRPQDAVTVLAGLRAAVGSPTRVRYVRGASVDTADTSGFADAMRAAREAEAVVLVLGEREDMSAEAASRASIELPGSQLALAHAVFQATRPTAGRPRTPVVVVLMNGRPLAIQQLSDEAPAIVESWFLGVQHGNAVADVLFGDYNPAGRLPVTVPRATGQVPLYYNHLNTGRPAVAKEKYTSKYLDIPWTPLYPFGFGLSYTTFAYKNLRLSTDQMRAGDTLGVSVDVANTGSRTGEEVVQLYIRDDVASVAQPVKALKGFERVTLAAGETKTVRFKVSPEALALYDSTLRRVVEPGAFTIYVGGSSESVQAARLMITGEPLVLEQAPTRAR